MSKDKNRISFKKYFYFLAAVLIVYVVSIISTFIFLSPRLQNFQEFENLDSWDIDGSAGGDFDGDGKEDVVTHTGCAFLSSVNEKDIPADRKCTYKGSAYYFDHKIMGGNSVYTQNKVGQKYIDISETDLSSKSSVIYAYMGKSKEGKWYIYADGKKISYSEIDKGLIKKIEVPLQAKLDSYLYFLTFFTLIGMMTFLPVYPIIVFITILIYVLRRFVLKRQA